MLGRITRVLLGVGIETLEKSGSRKLRSLGRIGIW
jgi:hypothetical protein